MKLGVDVYSIRSQGWDAFEYLEYCQRTGFNVVHFSDLVPFEGTDDAYLRQVRARAEALGLSLETGMGSICPSSASFYDEPGDAVVQVREMLHVASLLGSPVLRCLLGGAADRRSATPLRTHIENTLATCRAVREQALDLGIKLAIENHAGDLQGWELRALIEEAGSEYVGACIDTGNPLWVHEDPQVTLEHLAPYVVTSHVRDSIVWAHPRGAAFQWVAMGDGNVGIAAWAERFQVLCPGAPFTLEIITGRPPRLLNYLEEAYWDAFPDARASEFARFERLVRQGLPFMGHMVMVDGAPADTPPEYRAAWVAQQRYDLERSARYCREVLRVGE